MMTWQVYIKATGEQSAEMVTDEGAIYVTSNRGYNWKAAVQETVSATLNRYTFLLNRCRNNEVGSSYLLRVKIIHTGVVPC